MKLLFIEIKLIIADFLDINTLYNLCLVNKDNYYIFYDYFLKRNNKQSNLLLQFIQNYLPIRLNVITHKMAINTRIHNTINTKIINLTNYDYTFLENFNIIFYDNFKVTTYACIFSDTIFSNIKKQYKITYKKNDETTYTLKINDNKK